MIEKVIFFDLLKLYGCRSIVRRNHKERRRILKMFEEVLWITISWVSFFNIYHFYILMDMNGWVHSAILVYGCFSFFFFWVPEKEGRDEGSWMESSLNLLLKIWCTFWNKILWYLKELEKRRFKIPFSDWHHLVNDSVVVKNLDF